MYNLPEISSYGEYSNDNYRVNSFMVDLDKIRLYYSYETIVAFYTIQTGLVACENIWSVTTGKHLNWIQPDKSERIKYDDFQEQLKDALDAHII